MSEQACVVVVTFFVFFCFFCLFLFLFESNSISSTFFLSLSLSLSLYCLTAQWGLNYRIGGYGRSFVNLDVEEMVDQYKRANRRLIILNYSGTLIEEQSMDQ